LTDPADVFGAARVAYFETTPVPQPRTMKRADAATSAGHGLRPEKTGKTRISRIRVNATGAAIDYCGHRWVAIDVLGGC
jgi:hypothetical protein